MSLKKYLKTSFDYDVVGLAPYTDEQREDLIVRSVTERKHYNISRFNKESKEAKN
jgi:hypothetical protein